MGFRIFGALALLPLCWAPVSAQWLSTAGPPNAQVNAVLVHDRAVFVGTEKPGGIFKSTDSGRTWRAMNFRLNESGLGVLQKSIMCMTSLGRYLFAGTTDSILRSEDGGETWAMHSEGLETNWVSHMAAAEGVVYAGYFGGLFRSLDSGATWTKVALEGGLEEVDALTARDSLVYVALGDNRSLQRSTDRGETWSTITPTTSFEILTLALAPGHIFAGGGTGVHCSRDGGITWSRSSVGSGTDVTALTGEPNSLFAATTDGLHRSLDTGKTWRLISDSRHYNLDREFYAVAKHAELVYAGGWGGAIRVPAGGNGSPVQVNFGLGGSPITGLGVSGSHIYAGYNMKGFRGSNRGAVWRGIQSYGRIIPTAYLTLGSKVLGASTGDDVGAGVRSFSDDDLSLTGSNADLGLGKVNVYSLVRVGNVVFAASQRGVYRSADTGNYWEPATEGMGEIPTQLLTAHGTLLFAGSHAQGVFLSSDLGVAWQAVGAGVLKNPVLALAGTGDVILAAADSGRELMRSTDGGRNWVRTQAGIDFPRVNALASSGAIVLAGTPRGVFRSLDAGLSWSTFSEGMFSLVSHGLSREKDETITKLVIGTTFMAVGTARGTVWQRPVSDLTLSLAKRPHHPINPGTSIRFFDSRKGIMVFRSVPGSRHEDRAVDARGTELR